MVRLLIGQQGMWTGLSGAWAVIVLTFIALVQGHRSSGAVDICMSDSFTARCWENEVVIMTSAEYGRMELGECVKADLGYMGCKKDVLQLSDRWCSGRRSCDVIVPTKDLDELNPCLGELRTYLRASYRCIKVAFGSKEYCSAHQKVTLDNNRGFLSNEVAEETGCGSTRTPWVIRALPGQTINLTLHDYGIWRLQDEIMGDISYQRQTEFKYGYIYEKATGTNRTIQESSSRMSHLFTSQSNSVEIHLLTLPKRKFNRRFIVEYQTIGCADLNPARHAWYKREGNKAVIGCHSTRQEKTWHLRCEGNNWIGVVGNCSAPDSSSAYSQADGLPFSTEVSITIIIGIAVVFAALVLVIGTIYLRNLRRRKSSHGKSSREPLRKHVSSSQQYRQPSQSRRTDESIEDYNKSNKSDIIVPAHSQSASDVISIGTGNAYTHIWERPLPDPHGNQVTSDSDYASQSNYSGTTRQSKTTGGYDVDESTESVYNPEPASLKDVNETTSGRRYFMNKSD